MMRNSKARGKAGDSKPYAMFRMLHAQDRQASNESAFERIGGAFGSTGVEQERISTFRKRI